MLRIKGLFKKQAELILGSRKQALLYAVLLALLPYCTWLAMVVIALVTLRKGKEEGGRVLLSVMLAHSVVLLVSLPVYVAFFQTMLVFAPVYCGAYVLRESATWQAVAAVLFLLVLVSSVLIQQMIPEWILSQYELIQSLVAASQPEHALSKWLSDTSEVSIVVMANYTLGIQLLSTVLSIWAALMLARSLQAQLFYPGGFRTELLAFRGNRVSLVVILLFFGAAWQCNVVAINVLPVLILFYLLAGLSLCANFIMRKTSRMLLVILILPVILMPFVMVPLYIILGLLDSLFNIRLAFCR